MYYSHLDAFRVRASQVLEGTAPNTRCAQRGPIYHATFLAMYQNFTLGM
jgi:hypothetical protein